MLLGRCGWGQIPCGLSSLLSFNKPCIALKAVWRGVLGGQAPQNEYGVGHGEAPLTLNIARTWVAVQPRHGTQFVQGCTVGPQSLPWKWQPGLFCPVLPCSAAGPPTRLEYPQEVGCFSPGGASGFPFAALARCFTMSLEKVFIPRTEEWNAPCQQG